MVKRDAEYLDGGLLLDRSSIEDNGGYWPVPTMVGNCKCVCVCPCKDPLYA